MVIKYPVTPNTMLCTCSSTLSVTDEFRCSNYLITGDTKYGCTNMVWWRIDQI